MGKSLILKRIMNKKQKICKTCGLPYTKYMFHMSCRTIELDNKQEDFDVEDIELKKEPFYDFGLKRLIKNLFLKEL